MPKAIPAISSNYNLFCFSRAAQHQRSDQIIGAKSGSFCNSAIILGPKNRRKENGIPIEVGLIRGGQGWLLRFASRMFVCFCGNVANTSHLN